MGEKRGRPRKVLSREQIEAAMSKTLSNRSAARYLHVSYPHFKKYAKIYEDKESGKSLFEIHKNPSGKGIPRLFDKPVNSENLREVMEGKAPIYSWSPEKLKTRIIQEGILEEKCTSCGFSEKRVIDLKAPLILHFKDGNKANWKLENLGFLCYNCYFLYVENILSKKQIDSLEDYHTGKNTEEVDWEMDDYMREHLEDLGLMEDEDEIDDDLVDYL